MKNTKLIIGLLLCLLFCLFTVACKGNSEQTEIPTNDISEQVAQSICVFDGSAPTCNIIIPPSTDTLTKKAANVLSSYLEKQCGAKFKVSIDTRLDPGDSAEILFGATNRSESSNVSLPSSGYSVVQKGNKIIVQATEPEMLLSAIAELIDNIKKEENKLFISRGLNISSELPSTQRDNWQLEGIPAYTGGTLAKDIRKDAYHIGNFSSNTTMATIYSTSFGDFANYLSILKSNRFVVEMQNEGENIQSAYASRFDQNIYVYYALESKIARVINISKGLSKPSEFSYTYEKKPDDTTVLYNMGILYTESANNGQFQIIKLADNSLIVIDGGSTVQLTERNKLLNFMREITGTPEGEKIRIACWHITHDHGDHFPGFHQFLMTHHNQVDIERMLVNFETPSSNFNSLAECLKLWYPDMIYHTALTGEILQLADVKIEVLYSRHDLVDIDGADYTHTTFEGYGEVDFNDTSTVLRFTLDGGTYMNVGDMGTAAQAFLNKNYRNDLKCDIMQVSHHGYNTIYNFYKYCSPTHSLYTNEKDIVWNWGYKNLGQEILGVIKNNTSGNIYYSGNGTVGFSFIDGKPTEVYNGEIIR